MWKSFKKNVIIVYGAYQSGDDERISIREDGIVEGGEMYI